MGAPLGNKNAAGNHNGRSTVKKTSYGYVQMSNKLNKAWKTSVLRHAKVQHMAAKKELQQEERVI